MELHGRTKEEHLIRDKATIKALLRTSPFGPKYSGQPRHNYDKHELVLYVNDKRDVPELLGVTMLNNDEGEWPVKCRLPSVNPGLNYGVLKGIHPIVNVHRIKAELISNGEDVEEVIRIESNNGPTYCVKVRFKLETPNTVLYAGDNKIIHPFNPPVKSLICFNCSKPGHKADYCNSRPRCPKCGKAHSRRDCTTDTTVVTNRRCANCNGQHKATWGGCQIVKNERQIMKIRLNEEVPRHEAKNIWKVREEQRQRNLHTDNQHDSTEQLPSGR